MKILVYGGAFNPVHYAHISHLKLAAKKFGFDKIIVVPNKIAHFKDASELANVSDRLNMLELALEQLNDLDIELEISMIEIESQIRLYAIDVVKIIQAENTDASLYFLIGSDQAMQLDKWYDIDNLLQKVTFIVVKRDLDFVAEDLLVLENLILPYSSTATRTTYQTTGIVKVDKYIRENGLYLNSLINNYLSVNRVQHSKNVAKLAVEMAILHNIDERKAYIAAMLHDIAKELPLKEQYNLVKENDVTFELHDQTVHAYAAYNFVKEKFKIDDVEILNAIKWHTTAYFEMTQLDKLIYVSDMLSCERDFSDIQELREILKYNLNECFKLCYLKSFSYLELKKVKISNDLLKLKSKIERNEV